MCSIPNWILENKRPIVNSIGLIFDIVGAFLVASEVVSRFDGNKYVAYEPGPTTTALGETVMGPQVRETQALLKWERNKYLMMKIGLVVLVLGFIFQILSDWL